MERKYMNGEKALNKPDLTTQWSSTVGVGTIIQRKQARVLQYKS